MPGLATAWRPTSSLMAGGWATLRQMGEALAGAGRTTRNGKPLSPEQIKRRLQRLALAC